MKPDEALFKITNIYRLPYFNYEVLTRQEFNEQIKHVNSGVILAVRDIFDKNDFLEIHRKYFKKIMYQGQVIETNERFVNYRIKDKSIYLKLNDTVTINFGLNSKFLQYIISKKIVSYDHKHINKYLETI
jgi:hypothetical protein